jgi:hypothetical protein
MATHGVCWAQTHDKSNDVDLDNFDLTPAVAAGSAMLGATFKRRAVIHEFGHMLGFQDEYPDPKTGKFLKNASHAGERDSIMYWEDTVYPRHYVLFADWLSLRFRQPHDWKVNGTVDMTNALL